MALWFLWLLVPLAAALCVHGVGWAFWTLTGRAERFLPLSPVWIGYAMRRVIKGPRAAD